MEVGVLLASLQRMAQHLISKKMALAAILDLAL